MLIAVTPQAAVCDILGFDPTRGAQQVPPMIRHIVPIRFREFRPPQTVANIDLYDRFGGIRVLNRDEVLGAPAIFHVNHPYPTGASPAERRRWFGRMNSELEKFREYKLNPEQLQSLRLVKQAAWKSIEIRLQSCLSGLNPTDLELGMDIIEANLGVQRDRLLLGKDSKDKNERRVGLWSLDDHATWMTPKQLKLVLAVAIAYFRVCRPELSSLMTPAYQAFVRCQHMLSYDDVSALIAFSQMRF